MRVAHDQRINPLDLRKGGADIFQPGGGRFGPNARMRQGNHKIGPLGTQPWHMGHGRLKNITALDPRAKLSTLPRCGLGRGKAHKPHTQRVNLPTRVGKLAGDDHAGRHKPVILQGMKPKAAHQIGRDRCKLGAGKMLHQKIQAMREFMVAKIDDIIAQKVHRGDHRMQSTGGVGHQQGLDIAQGATLQKVAIVNQKATAHLCPGLGDQAGGPRKPHSRAGAVFQIVP